MQYVILERFSLDSGMYFRNLYMWSWLILLPKTDQLNLAVRSLFIPIFVQCGDSSYHNRVIIDLVHNGGNAYHV